MEQTWYNESRSRSVFQTPHDPDHIIKGDIFNKMADTNISYCQMDDCGRVVVKRGLCSSHYKKAWRAGLIGTVKLCSISGCESRAEGNGWCAIHYYRWVKNGDPLITQAWRPQGTPEERFWARVALTADPSRCWLWQAHTNAKGYGCIKVDGVRWLTHRYAWLLTYGDPQSACVLHKCDTPACVNPEHLFLGTLADNHADMIAKGRNPVGEACSYAKLTNNMVLRIRRHLAEGMRVGAVARLMNIDRRRVTAIHTGRAWRSVQLEDGQY